ncbi:MULTISPECIES: host cell division inhibitor Icd-like protein [Klebsiella]|uniref:host cell division inhibitor Icd-like protein n=2 Tax=Klebsiella TaxID=570 RepID=UPI002810BC9F|nr:MULTISPECIES: host cell division inhibitor Icd-like protein [Klebsiella]MDU8933868.1 host cell division inhibitor Icd-like protein [Klebsiella pneumoniae]
MYGPVKILSLTLGPYTNMCIPEKTTPRTAGTVPGRLTKTLYEVTNMAGSQHTQTRPKFTWLFLAKPKSHPNCHPVIVRFSADTEDAARQAFPGWSLTFAAKIRTEFPCRFAFHDYASGMSLAFDNGEVRHA